MIALSVALGLVAFVLLLPALSDLLSLLRIVTRRPSPATGAGADKLPRFLFLVPAHNEELLLPACLESLQRMRYPRRRVDIIVVADNCTDRTADIARDAGVSCLVRTAPADAGKPQAISWAIAQLPVGDYDSIVIVDADTEVDARFAACAAESVGLRDKVLQPYNDVNNPDENALTRMAAVLSAANHGLAYVLKTRAGLNVPLSVGMCIGSRVLAAQGWTVRSICEDWELYALLTTRGVRIEEIPKARIRAQEAATLRASGSQRRRWTAGKLAVLAGYVGPLLRSRQAGVRQKIDALAELSAPGPAVHLCLVAATIAAALLLHPPAFGWFAVLLLFTLLRPAVYTLAALGRDREPLRATLAFALLPLYAAWRMWIAVTSLGTLGSRLWIRTERHPSR